MCVSILCVRRIISLKRISKEACAAIHNGVLIPTIIWGTEFWLLRERVRKENVRLKVI